MAKYLIRSSAYIRGTYFEADAGHPAAIDLPADVEPSSNWLPMDKPAQEALQALAKKRIGLLPDDERKKLSEAQIKKLLEPKPLVNEVPAAPKFADMKPKAASGPQPKKTHETGGDDSL